MEIVWTLVVVILVVFVYWYSRQPDEYDKKKNEDV